MPFTSKRNKDGKGGAWTCQLYFDYNADGPGTGNYYTDPELKMKLKDYIGENEVIVRVSYFKHPLYGIQLSSVFLHHAFVVFKTEHWWWSIEKNSEGITIQRAKKIKNVRDKYRQERRTVYWWNPFSTPTLVKETPGKQKRFGRSSSFFGPKISFIGNTIGCSATAKDLQVLSGVGANLFIHINMFLCQIFA